MKTSLCPLHSANAQTCPVDVNLTAGEYARLEAIATALGCPLDQLARRLVMQPVKWALLLIRNRPNVTGELVAANPDHCPAAACADAQDHPLTLSLAADEFAKLAAVAAGYLATPENVARTFILEASKWTATINSKRLAGPGALVVVGVSHG
ncbi:hypothetical protein [uncultured Thiodictyon sp.]|uniref:hypothetical protein n=1 Tax=uncultured Thiodictyon sp. TaxID=1846217 RepID=UPI0025CC42CC|nr:hypothetical protein [uncultured Thiodictyon sp.]